MVRASILSVISFLTVFVVKTHSHQIKCLENGRFYRDPDRPPNEMSTVVECSKYFLCLEGEVFNFKCSPDLVFDVSRQICDSKSHVHNCHLTMDSSSGLAKNNSTCSFDHLPCNDGVCIPSEYFCDGHLDCSDGADEVGCDLVEDPHAAKHCDLEKCKLPECFCSHDGTRIPNDLKPSETPQMVVLTFSGAINHENWEIYRELFKREWRNPNGCSIKATFFVSHASNNYHLTQRLWNDGHEIAVNSVTNRSPPEWWSNNATVEDWFDETIGEANILHKFGGIRLREIRGLQAPFLQVGWNRQFLMMKEFGFVYDASILAPSIGRPLWPYTLDYKISHKCDSTQNCPSRSYPGIWELVVNPLEVANFSCDSIDSCIADLSGDEIYKILVQNFNRHYLANRAPFRLDLHSSWLQNRENLEALQDFMVSVMQHPDVWFVTNWQVIQWMSEPTIASSINSFEPWGCDTLFYEKEIACRVPNMCKLQSNNSQRDGFLYTCFQCPVNYPWIENEFGVM